MSGDHLVYNELNTNNFGPNPDYNPYMNNNPASYNNGGWNAQSNNAGPYSGPYNPMDQLANPNQQYLNQQKGYPIK